MSVDLLMSVCLQAGQQLADPARHPSPPAGCLGDDAAREKLVKEVENQITADIHAILGMMIPRVVACVQADHSLTGAASANLPGLPPDEAAGVAMRFYAGFLDIAKVLREKYRQGPGLPDVVITSEQRGKQMEGVHSRAQQDGVYAAGARFGWWGLVRRGEQVFDDGISDSHKNLYLADYAQHQKASVKATEP